MRTELALWGVAFLLVGVSFLVSGTQLAWIGVGLSFVILVHQNRRHRREDRERREG